MNTIYCKTLKEFVTICKQEHTEEYEVVLPICVKHKGTTAYRKAVLYNANEIPFIRIYTHISRYGKAIDNVVFGTNCLQFLLERGINTHISSVDIQDIPDSIDPTFHNLVVNQLYIHQDRVSFIKLDVPLNPNLE